MIRDIFLEFGIDSYGFVAGKLCSPKNLRLHASLPEDCRVIFFLIPYYTGDTKGKISKYAAVHDYHLFAKEVFASLLEYIKTNYPESFASGFSDHSPFCESTGAAMAGLGIVGKHSLLISEKYSSYIFIGELVTDLSSEILSLEGISEGDGTVRRCEDCSLCALACPSGSIEGGERDLCASSVSQKKGELSEKESEILKKSHSIWGCDICQDACPHTKRAVREGTIYTPIDFFKSSFIGDDPKSRIAAMDSEEFSLYPFSWRKREIIERNIKILDSGEAENG